MKNNFSIRQWYRNSKDQIPLAIERHSKLPDKILTKLNILVLGEALPSIAAISQVNLESKFIVSNHAWSLDVISGSFSRFILHQRNWNKSQLKTFYATPARLKFLKSSQ